MQVRHHNKNWNQILITLLVCYFVANSQNITIVEHPSSLLIPVNTTAIFSCTAHVQCTSQSCTLTGHWIVNGNFYSSNTDRNDMVDKITLSLTLNVSEAQAHNNSNIHCQFDVVGNTGLENSAEATLLVIGGEILLYTCVYRMIYLNVRNLLLRNPTYCKNRFIITFFHTFINISMMILCIVLCCRFTIAIKPFIKDEWITHNTNLVSTISMTWPCHSLL